MARKPAKKSDERTGHSESEPEPTGRAWFDEEGHLNQSGPVPLSRYIGALSDQLRLFLARLDSCERTEVGDYLLTDSHVGDLGGIRILWENVVSLAGAIISKTLPAMTTEERRRFEQGSIVITQTTPNRNAKPLADAMQQLIFSILYKADGSWTSEISSARVAKIRTISDELPLHQVAWERSERGRTQTIAQPVAPDLIVGMQAGLAVASGSNSGKPSRPHACVPLTADHESILATLGKNPAKCMTVIDVSSIGTIRNRETVGRLLKELQEVRMVFLPYGVKKGYALTELGQSRVKGASPT